MQLPLSECLRSRYNRITVRHKYRVITEVAMLFNFPVATDVLGGSPVLRALPKV